MKSTLLHIANLWTLMGHPHGQAEWSLDRKLNAIASAGFDGVCWAPSKELTEGCRARGLRFIGGMASGERAAFPAILDELQASGTQHVNVQLGAHDTAAEEALLLTLELLEQGASRGLQLAIETHRGTCTETPEKFFALADGYAQRTGKLLPVSWDFSHFAVLKHLLPAEFTERLLLRLELVQHAQQFHFRPFNGHHAQVAITGSHGELTHEVRAWLPFAEAVLRCWLEGNRESGRELLICPELGPVVGGYALSTFPASWEDAKVLRRVIAEAWDRVCAAL
jgi:hypothetical protein